MKPENTDTSATDSPGTPVRETDMINNSGEHIKIVTDSQGTRILDDSGRVIRTSGGDRHDEYVEEYERGGWEVAEQTDE